MAARVRAGPDALRGRVGHRLSSEESASGEDPAETVPAMATVTAAPPERVLSGRTSHFVLPKQWAPVTIEAPDGRRVTVQEQPGRDWRCCAADDVPHDYLPLHSSLGAALAEALPGVGPDDPWLRTTLLRLAPQELVEKAPPERRG